MVPGGLFGWTSPHVQPLTPVSEVSEPPESPSPYGDGPSGDAGVGLRDGEGVGEEDVEEDEVEPPPAAVSFWRLFEFADGLDWALMAAGALAAAAHGAALVVYLHYFGRTLNLLDSERIESALHGRSQELLNHFMEVSSCFGCLAINCTHDRICGVIFIARDSLILLLLGLGRF